MGRPIKKSFFGNMNPGGVGGEGVASVTIVSGGAGYNPATTTVTFSAPQIVGGITATGTATIDGAGLVTGVVVTQSGSGYTTAPTVTITDSDAGAEVAGTYTAVLTTTRSNAIVMSAFIPVANGGTSAVPGDIIKQESSRRYLVQTAQGTGQCTLVAAAPTAGQLTFTATDSAGGTYYVTKLSARKATLVKGDRTGTQFASGTQVLWTTNGAVAGQSVTLSTM